MVTTVLGIGILGIEVPDDRPVFLAASPSTSPPD
jgi:hypothetical protein